ncbi:MAG: aminopeptidase Y [Patescibacteria group bacterium]|nr:MAG: aminopeptidase Y [Patescibacteria group bacterium]
MSRILKIANFLKENNLDGFLVSNFYNIFYLTSFKGLSSDEREVWVLVLKDEVFLFTDRRYDNKLKIQSASWRTKVKVVFYEEGKNILHYLREIIDKRNIKKIGFEGEDLKFFEYKKFVDELKIDFVPVYFLIKKLRANKDEQEIEFIKKACQIGDQCLNEISKFIKPGISEKEIAFKIEFWLKEKGYDLAFYPIIAVDENSSIPHYDTREGEGKVKNNSVVLIDFGVKYKNYNSDITRMFFINPDIEKINIYQKLLKIQKKSIEFFAVAKPQSYKQVDLYTRELFKKEGLPFFPHSLGHGVGLEIHEYPKVSFLIDEAIEDNHIFTIEPGVYFPSRWGLRIEDTVIYQKNKVELLTNFAKDIF